MATGMTAAPLPAPPLRLVWNPLACSDTLIRPNTLLMAKLSWLLLVVSGFGRDLLAPYTPAVGLFQTIPGESTWFAIAFWLGGLCLLFNRFARFSAVLVGAVALLAPFESVPAWHPHAWVCGCVLTLAALQGPAENPRFLRALLVVVHGAALTGAIKGSLWVHAALAKPWSSEDYAGTVARALAAHLPPGSLEPVLREATLVICAAVTLGMLVPRLRRAAAWLALFFYTALYLMQGSREIALFAGAVAIAQIAVLDWPRFVIVVWPRSCGWPLWLRVALDRYDFERRTDWPRPADPDAHLEAWFDVRPVAGARAVANLMLFFPTFYFVLLFVLVAIHAILPRFVAVPMNAAIVAGLLGFSAFSHLGRLRARLTKRPPPPAPSEGAKPATEQSDAEEPRPEHPKGMAERGADQATSGPKPPEATPAEADEFIIDIDTRPPSDP